MTCAKPHGQQGDLLVVAIAALLYAPYAQGQVLYGSLVGNVVDASNAPVPAVIVKILNKQTGQTRETLTNDSGAYSFPTVSSGLFDITVARAGFQTATKRDVTVSINS